MHQEFARLGWPEGDRAGRLAACALLLGLDGLGSSRDLSMGQAGYLARLLAGMPDAGGLAAELDARRQPALRAAAGSGPGLADLGCWLLVAVVAAVRSRRSARAGREGSR